MVDANMSDIEWLQVRASRLKSLLDDPQPGLLTWQDAYMKVVLELMDYWEKAKVGT